MTSLETLPVAVIGAGPVGLAAAAHLIQRGLPVKVYETGDKVAANVRDWGHVHLFSPWEYNTDAAARALLQSHGWQEPPARAMPTGSDLYEAYLKPLAETPEMAAVIETGVKVTAITRHGADKVLSKGREAKPFVLAVSNGNGTIRRDLARAVIDASGTWTAPNPLGAGGILAEGEAENADRIAYGIPDVLGRDRAEYEGKTTLVVGAGHSAANVLLDLARLAERNPATSIAWATRGENLMRVYGGGSADQLPARGELGSRLKALVDSGRIALVAGFSVTRIRAVDEKVAVEGETAGGIREVGPVDRIVVSTGQRPDLNLTRELRLDLDPVAGKLEGARPADRPEPALVRIGPAARPPRTRPSGAGILHRRDQELRTRADLPDADRLRAGPLGRGGHSRRPCRGRRHPPRPAGDGRVLDQPSRRRCPCIIRLLRRSRAGSGRCLLRRGCRGQGRGQVGLRLRSGEDAGEGCGTRGLLLRSVRVESGE